MPSVQFLPTISLSSEMDSEMDLETTSQHAKSMTIMKTAIPSRSSSRKKSSNSREQVQLKGKAANAATRKSNADCSGTAIDQSGLKKDEEKYNKDNEVVR